MNTNFNKIIFCFCIVFFINSCHTFEHQNIFLENTKRISNLELSNKQGKKSEIDDQKPKDNKEMAPINLPKKKEKVQKLTLQTKIKVPNVNNFNLDRFVNWNEEEIIKSLGKSNFIKQEGRLKNYQYHLKECFIDVFFLKKNGVYLVSYIETRPTILNGKININACFKEINQILN